MPLFYEVRGSSNKEWDFFYSTVNLHARLMKSLQSYHVFLANHMNHIRRVTKFQFLLLGNIRKLGKHPWPAQYRWSPWQHVKIYSLFFYEYLYILTQYIYNQIKKVMFQSLELFPWKQV